MQLMGSSAASSVVKQLAACIHAPASLTKCPAAQQTERQRSMQALVRSSAAVAVSPFDPAWLLQGMFLEGAGWDRDNGCLCEPNPMELIVPMPIMLFKPVENKKKSQRNIYTCPLYIYPHRTGTRERPSFMINVDLKSGSADPDFWIMRGTALLLSLAQ